MSRLLYKSLEYNPTVWECETGWSAVIYKLLMPLSHRLWTELQHLLEKWICHWESFRLIEMANLYIHILADECSGIHKRIQDFIKTFNSDGWAPTCWDLQMIPLTLLKKRENVREGFQVLEAWSRGRGEEYHCSSWSLLSSKILVKQMKICKKAGHRFETESSEKGTYLDAVEMNKPLRQLTFWVWRSQIF